MTRGTWPRAWMGGVRGWLTTTGGSAWQRVRADAWLLLQRTAAATLAWILARRIGSHPEPFFAPIAAVVSLNAGLGERGLNALRLLLGVLIGIVAGELTLVALAGGSGSLAIATLAAMAVARAFRGQPIVVAQAAAGAILTVAIGEGEGGINRLVDALLGAGVALVFSQLLFTPDPMRLLHRAESEVLSGLVRGLHLTSRALATGADDVADDAMRVLRDLRGPLVALAKTSAASTRVARHSLAWRGNLTPAVHEQENAGHLDLLGVSCLMLARAALTATPDSDQHLSATIGRIAELLADLAASPGDTATRQGVVDRVPDVLRPLGGDDPATTVAAAAAAVRVVLGDVLQFAGVEPGDAVAMIREGTKDVRIRATPRTSTIPYLPRLRHRDDRRPDGPAPPSRLTGDPRGRTSGMARTRPVVTVAALYGAGGSEVGRQVAQRLGVELLDRAIPEAAAGRAGMPQTAVASYDEEPRSAPGRLAGNLGRLSTVTGGTGGSMERLDLQERAVRGHFEEVIARCRVTGGVVLGRGGMVVLGSVPWALHVRLRGPEEARVRQGAAAEGIDLASARERQQQKDRARRGYLRDVYGIDGEDLSLYHLVLDSTALPLDLCADIIVDAATARLRAHEQDSTT